MAEQKESGGFGRALKGLLFEDEPESATESSVAGTQAERPVPTQRPTSFSSPAPNGAPDPEVRALLDKYVQEAALPAFSAFNQTMTKLVDVIPDEGTRIKAALKTLPDGNGLQAVLTDIDECVGEIDKKERDATEAAEKAVKERVGSREAQVAATRGDIEAKRAQIVDLQKEIADLEAAAAKAQAEIASERSAIDEKKRKFAATAAAYRAELAKQREKITQHGKGA